ncbi:MAG: ABC transporter substrate-binding protein [Anaerolineales bacterium]|nr:ABC transporter substrate-binding protein [Anaerolineales bacterium]NTW11787.1 ABC transporter substrate-binding protein [Anaerolineales bacterium]
MKVLRKFAFLLVAMSLVLAACTPAATEAPAVDEPVVPTEVPAEAPTEAVAEEPAGLTCAEPVKVGLITDASGALAIYGAHILRSFMLGMEYATGAPGSAGEKFDFAATQENTFKIDECEFIVYVRDDGSNPENTATVARELIDVQGVNILVGTVSSGATATLQGIALENQIPLIVAPAAANDITGVNFNEYTFRTSRNNYQDAMNECVALTQQYKSFVQIAPDYAFGKGSAAAFRDACTLEGAEFVADDIFAPLDTTDFTPYMEQIANSGAEAYIVTWAGSGFVSLVQAAKDQGVTESMALGATFIDNILMPTFFSNAVGTTAGILYHYSAPKNPANDFLVANTKPRYGVNPDLFDGDGMNAAILVVEAVKATGGDTSGEALQAVMEGMEFEGPKGTVYIRPEDHVAIQDMYILKLVNVTDPDANFYEYVDTTRPEPPCLLPETLKDRCGDLPYGTLSGQ